MIDRERFYTALSEGKVDEVKQLTEGALNAGETAEKVLKEGLIQGMERIGVRFKNCEIYLPEVLIAARAMHAGMAVLKPTLAKSPGVMAGRAVVGTVKGDLHDIGKNLVAMMLEGGGFEVTDLGIDVAPERFVESLKQSQAQILGMSALLTTTMRQMKATLQAIENAGLRNRVKVMVGGAPVTERFAKEVGADGYAPDAASAIDLAKSFVGK
jgi:5-methyltetrahydrofolate--homocysteine methyltransferase